MTWTRFKPRHPKRLAAALCSTFIAAGAMAYVASGGHGHHDADAPPGGQVAQNDPGSGGGAPGEGQDGGPQGGASGGAGGEFQNLTTGGANGPGDGHDGPGSGGFMPNGENGLVRLADYVQSRGGKQNNGNDNSDHTPGHPHDDPIAPDAGGLGAGPGSGNGSTQVASEDPPAGGPGLPGGGGGGGGVGGFAGGGGGGGSPGVSNGDAGGDKRGDAGGDRGGIDAGTPSADGPKGPGDGNGGDFCVVTPLNTCGQDPAGGDPPQQPPIFDTPKGPTEDGPSYGAPLQDVAGVPEPAMWLMMILGFGGAGSMLRAQRKKAGRTLA